MIGAFATAFVLLLGNTALAQQVQPPEPAPKRFFLEVGFGLTTTAMAAETVLPKEDSWPLGLGLTVAGGVRLGAWAFGPRFSSDAHFDGSHARILLGQVQLRPNLDVLHFSLWIGFGYVWHENLDLRGLGLGTYDSGGFAFGIGPRMRVATFEPDTTLHVGFRNYILAITRPALGECTDEHGCNGVFYPDDRATAGRLSMGLEVVLTHDL